MKEKYIAPAYGLNSWRKVDTFTRNVYDFSDRKSIATVVIENLIWLSLFGGLYFVISLVI